MINIPAPQNVSTLEDLARAINYNGAAYRGASIPSANLLMINQCNIPDNMREKHLSIWVEDDTLNLYYVTQEDFDHNGVDQFADEVIRCINCLIKHYKYTAYFILALEVQCRDGKEYGFGFKRKTFNEK